MRPLDKHVHAIITALAFAGCYTGAGRPAEEAATETEGGTGGTGGTEETGVDEPVAELSCEGEDVAFVPIRRLTRTQYANTVRDLLGLDVDVTDELPADVTVGGFDNNVDALSLNPTLTEAYYRLAGELAAMVVDDDAAWARVVPCEPAQAECRDTMVRTFLRRAWRRPVADEELPAYLGLFDEAEQSGAGFEGGVSLVVQAALMSPGFLLHLELDPHPDDPQLRALTSHELASRLSYALWSTMPDDELFAAAEAEALLDAEGLQAQVDRMLASPRAAALVDGFAAQWLGFASIQSRNIPDPTLFPEFDDALARAMEAQTRATMSDHLLGGRPFSELLTSDVTYLDPTLAELYGVPHPTGEGLHEVTLDDPRRHGLLTHASILTITSAPDHTSPVRRGLWVLTNLLCSEPPPPPAGVEASLDEIDSDATSLRELLEEHRADPTCAGCHEAMDEIGFGFEHYDPIGRWRTEDHYGAIDASGQLPDLADPTQTVEFDGIPELAAILQADPRLSTCITRKLFTYVQARLPTAGDHCRVNTVATDFAAAELQFASAVHALVLGDSFRFRRGAPLPE